MEIPEYYVHDGQLIRVIEEPEHARITMHVRLPNLAREEQLEPRLLVFEDVYGYKVVEGYMNRCPALLNFKVIGTEERWTWVRLDTNIGYREILCSSVLLKNETVA